MEEAKPKVAIIGSGISGLVSAYLLSEKYEVHIYEAASTIGMDSHSISTNGARIDVPLRVFSEGYYPYMTKLYQLVGVEFDTASYAFNLCDDNFSSPYFRFFSLYFGMNAYSIPFIFGLSGLNVSFFKLVWEFCSFHSRGLKDLKQRPKEVAEMSFGEYMKQEGYSETFTMKLLVPMYAVVCTCTYDAVLRYPADMMLDYMVGRQGIRSTQLRAYNGTKDVVKRLLQKCDQKNQHVSTPIKSVEFVGLGENKQVKVSYCSGKTTDVEEYFEHVVFSTQANTTHSLLSKNKSTHAEQIQNALGSFKYELNRVLVHTDDTLMPKRKVDWSPLNMIPFKNGREVECNVWMNAIDKRLGKELKADVFQTWNPRTLPRKETVIRDSVFQRPTIDKGSVQAMRDLHTLQGKDHLWFTGAYSLYSIPLLENGTRSALKVASMLGASHPDLMWCGESACELLKVEEEQVKKSSFVTKFILTTGCVAGLVWVFNKYSDK